MTSSFELNADMHSAVTIMILIYSGGMCASGPPVDHKVKYRSHVVYKRPAAGGNFSD